jgi:hypothetical protein
MEPYQGPTLSTRQAKPLNCAGTGARRREPPAAQPRQETTAAGTDSLAACAIIARSMQWFRGGTAT